MIQEFNIWTNGNFGFGSVMLKKHSNLSVGILWDIPDALLVFFYITLGHNWADILHNEPTAGGYWFGVMLIHHWMISISIFKR